HQNRKIYSWDDDSEGERKCSQEPEAAQDQPSLVAVPNRRDCIHDLVAGGCVGCEAEQHADAEIEPVEHDIEEHRQSEDQGPNRHEVENLAHRISPSARPSAPASTGACGRPPSIGDASSLECSGPLRTMRSIR